MKNLIYASALALLIATASGTQAQNLDNQTVIITASNAPTNQLLVYNTSGQLIQTVSTDGTGGVGGNSGGIDAHGKRIAVVNFGSQTVSLFERDEHGVRLVQVVPTESAPVSVAFGHGHLYILGTTKVESHRIFDSWVNPTADGEGALVVADGSAAQVGVLEDQLVISEKSNVIETANLSWDGAVDSSAKAVSNIPANVNAPFGLVTRGNDAYVSIAHANEISLVRDDTVVTITGSGTQSAPCWLALDGPFLFSSNSPSMSVSRYLVYGTKIIQQAAVAASFNGAPTDIAYKERLAAVIDSNGTVSHLSIFKVDGDGNLALKGVATTNSANGVAIIPGE